MVVELLGQDAPAWLASPVVQKGIWIVATWTIALLLTVLNNRFFDRVDQRLTTYGIPQRRLNKLDFAVDVFLILLATFITLWIMGVGEALWGAVAVTSVAGVILGLAAQQIGQNLLAGLMILFERPFIVGDTIKVDGEMGEVEKVSLVSTSLLTADGLKVLVPNGRVLNETVTNYSAKPSRRLAATIDVRESVALDQVREVLRDAVHQERHLIPGKPIRVYVTQSLDDGVRIETRYWVERESYMEHCVPSAMERLLDALNEAGIETAMPAQRVHVQEP